MTMQETVVRIEAVADALITRSDEITACARQHGSKVCNLFLPREARKTVELWLDFIAAIAMASSTNAVLAASPALATLADHVHESNDAVAVCLPKHSRNLITCISSGEQFILNLLLRGDSTALALAKIAHHLTLPLKRIFLLCFQKLHEQLTVGC